MTFFITTTDPTRRAIWLRLFGRDCLPVKQAKPRWIHRQGSGCADPFLTLVYDLDLSRLHDGDLCRLAGWLATRTGMEYAEALATVKRGWHVPAANCESVVQPVRAYAPPAFDFLARMFARQQVSYDLGY